MLVIGAKGFAKEVLEVLHLNNQLENLVFYDDVNNDVSGFLYSRFPILKTIEQIQNHFLEYGKDFTIAFGNPVFREKIYNKINDLGGVYTSTISPNINVGSYDVKFGPGCNILSNANFSNSVILGKGCIVYYNVMVTHDCVVGNFVELSPGATLLGNVHVGDNCHIGSNATILPNLKIGKNVIVGAGALVTKHLPDNCIAVGVPARIIKQN